MQTNFMRLLVQLMIFLYFSYALFTYATPATRTQNLNGEEDSSALPYFTRLGDGLGNYGEVVVDMKEEGFMERRIDLETQDYAGTGANPAHDPKSPGGA